MNATGPLFTFRLIPMISGILAQRGIDATELVQRVGLPLDALRGEITAPLSRIQAFVDEAAKRLDNDLFGLDLAEQIPAGAYGIAEFLARSAPTVEAGFETLRDYGALVNPVGQFRFAEGRLHYAVSSQRDTLGVQLNEYTIYYIIRQFGSVLGKPVPLEEVWFSHAGKSRKAVSQRLGCEVRFGAPDCGLALPRDVLALVPRTADPVLFKFLDGQAKAQLARSGSLDIVTQVVRVIEARLPHGDLGANAIAAVMATTVRSLQRHLDEAGTSFREVLAHVRNRRRGELQRGGVGETEIARQLGFSDARSMRRSLD